MAAVLAIAGGAALASVVGGVIALLRPPSSLTMSIVFGFASGVLIATVTLELIPEALELGSVAAAAGGFTCGFLAVWLFDLYVNRWHIAGEHAAQYRRVHAYHRSHRPRGDRVTVLAGGTSAEEVVEGMAIGAGMAVDPGVGLLVAIAIAIDNLSEGMSVGEFVLSGRGAGDGSPSPVRRTLAWTGLIGASLLGSALLGWLLLRDVSESVLGPLLAAGGGGMLYLTVSALVPPSEERQYQGSGALATGAGFLAILVLTSVR